MKGQFLYCFYFLISPLTLLLDQSTLRHSPLVISGGILRDLNVMKKCTCEICVFIWVMDKMAGWILS